MRLRSLIFTALAIFFTVFSVIPAMSAETAAVDGGPAFYTLERIETIVYGAPQGGGLISRLANAEKDVFGRELPGSLTERQTAMLDFLEKGSLTQPSVLFKLAVAEWAVSQRIYPSWPLARRVETLESILDGAVQGGALASRIEKIITRLLPEGTISSSVEVPASTVVKTALSKTLSVTNIKVDDKVVLNLTEEIVINKILVAPKGSRVFAHITKVKRPRSFGRPSEIEMAFDALEVLGPVSIPVTMGESAKKAMETDQATVGAVGASFAGAVLLGPVGLASGILVRGSDKEIKEGTLFYVETAGAATVNGYKVPEQISALVSSEDLSVPQGSSTVTK